METSKSLAKKAQPTTAPAAISMLRMFRYCHSRKIFDIIFIVIKSFSLAQINTDAALLHICGIVIHLILSAKVYSSVCIYLWQNTLTIVA